MEWSPYAFRSIDIGLQVIDEYALLRTQSEAF